MSKRKITIEIEFYFGDMVYIKSDPEQRVRQVTDIEIKPSGLVMYHLSCGPESSPHYDFELTKDRNILLTSNN